MATPPKHEQLTFPRFWQREAKLLAAPALKSRIFCRNETVENLTCGTAPAPMEIDFFPAVPCQNS